MQMQASCSHVAQITPCCQALRCRPASFRYPKPAAAPFQAHDFARRRLSTKAQAEEVQSEEGGSVDAAGLTSQFGGNSKFASVLAASLQRSGGADALTTGPERIDEPRISALEEVTMAALRDARRNIVMLEEMKKQIEGAIGREQTQFDRLHFSHKKAQSDAAWLRTMEKLLAQERAKNAELRAQQLR